ncbi:MAG: hypothetical protein HKN27_15625 [Silicimonas sp.]|nr:hypothetical protein [Silicimonas sp.]
MNHAETEIERFNYDARTANVALVVISILLVLTVLAVFSGQNSSTRDLLTGLVSIAFLAALLGVFFYTAKKRPVTLKVGPNGIDLPFAFKKPLAWHDIDRIEHRPPIGFWQKREWLRIYPIAGVLPDYRLKSPRKLELWHLLRSGISVPLHGIEGPSERILASIRRFHPVTAS